MLQAVVILILCIWVLCIYNVLLFVFCVDNLLCLVSHKECREGPLLLDSDKGDDILDIAPLHERILSQKRLGMARVVKESHSFTCHVYRQVEWTIACIFLYTNLPAY